MQSKDTQLPDGTSLVLLPLCDAGVGGYAGTPGFCGRSVSDRSKEVSDLAPHASV